MSNFKIIPDIVGEVTLFDQAVIRDIYFSHAMRFRVLPGKAALVSGCEFAERVFAEPGVRFQNCWFESGANELPEGAADASNYFAHPTPATP